MRNLSDNQIRAALRLIQRGEPLETVAENVHLRPDLVRAIALGEIRPRQAMIPRRRIPPRRCPRCGGQIFLWPCCVCEPDVMIPGTIENEENETEEGLTGSQEARKAEVEEWREKFGDPSNPAHPLYYKRGETEETGETPQKRKRSSTRGGNRRSSLPTGSDGDDSAANRRGADRSQGGGAR